MTAGDVEVDITTTDARPAAVFDGVDDNLNIDDALSLVANDTKGTWACWVKPTDGQPAAITRLITFGDTNGDERLVLELTTSGKLTGHARDAGASDWTLATDDAVWANGATDWTHVAMVHNEIEASIYINGIKVDQTFSGDQDKTTWFSDLAGLDNGRIGCGNFLNGGNTGFLNGAVSDVRIYNVAKTSAQMLALFNGDTSDTVGLKIHLPLEHPAEVLGSELNTQSNASAIGTEADATTGWTNAGFSTFESSTTQVFNGTHAMHFVANSTGDNATTNIPVVIGKRYRASIYYYLAAGGKGFIRFGQTGLAQEYLGQNADVSATWTEVTVDFTASTTTNLFCSVLETAPGDDTDIFIDNFTVKEIESDGTPDYTTVGAYYALNDGKLAKAIQDARVTANDNYIAAGIGKAQVVSAVIEENP